MWPFRKRPNYSPAAPYDHNAEAEKFLNSAKDFPAQPHIIANYIDIAVKETPATPVGASMSNPFVTIFKWIEKEEKVVYADILKYVPPVAKLAEMLFPSEATAIAAGTSAVLDIMQLIQNAVLMVEQKYAASGVASGTGVQKSAEVIALAGGAVTSLLKNLGITATADYIQSLIAAVVGVLNAQSISAPAALTPAASAAA